MKKKNTINTRRKLCAALCSIILQLLGVPMVLGGPSGPQVIQSVKKTHINMELQNATLKECFNKIEKQTDFRFSFDQELIDNNVKINYKAKKSPVSDLLMQISKQANLKFKQINNSISVQKLDNPNEEIQLEIVIQGIKISGRVTSTEDNDGLPGVSVVIKGTSQGTITDIEGKYSLVVPDKSTTLIFSYLGFKPQEVLVGDQTSIHIGLEADVTALEEVVVVGYGTQKRSDLTGAITSADPQMITERGTTSPIQSLQGSLPGVQVTNSTGRVGDEFNIVIRGKNSFSASPKPLFVVDGVITDNIDFLNPQDIAKIDILKDASSAAIYGSRGSNGVVIIQTKGGASVPGGTTISLESFYGVKKTARLPKMMDPEKWRDYHMSAYLATINPDNITTPEAYYNTVLPESSNSVLRRRFNDLDGFDWYDAVLKDGVQSNNHLSVTHRNAGSTYTFGIGYQNETGNIDKESLDKYTLRVSLDQELSKKFRSGVSISATSRTTQRGSDVAMQEAFRLNPFLSPWAVDENGNEIEGELFPQPGKLTDPVTGEFVANKTSTYNPLLEIANSNDATRGWNGIGTAFIQYSAIDWLILKSTFSGGLNTYRRGYSWGAQTNQGLNNNNLPSSQLDHFENINYTWDNQVNVTKSFGNHNLSFLALQSIYVDQTERSSMLSKEQPFETQFFNVGSGLQSTYGLSNSFSKSQLASFAMRLNYTFNNKYLLTVSNRWDGSSLLAEGEKWNAFPSAALGWKLKNESFLQNINTISDLKLRASYGLTGNNKISPYSSVNILDQQMYYDYDGSPTTGWVASKLGNKVITWENTREVNLGLDYGFLNYRVRGSVDWYNRLSEGLLVDQKLPLETGYEYIKANAGSIRNTGIELTLTTVNVQTKLISWETVLTFTKNTNTVESIYGQSKVDDVGNNLFIGEPADAHYNYKFDGIWQADEAATAAIYNQTEGQAKVVDVNTDNKISPDDDRLILGSSNPTWTGGLISRLGFANFDLNVTLFTQQGVLAYSNFHANFEDMRDRGRQKLDVASWYVPENEYGVPAQKSNKYPQPRNGGTYWRNDGVGYYKDASFVKITNISLGYTIPPSLLQKANIQQLRIYVNVLNPFVFSPYTGYDPEWAEASLGIGRVSSITTQLGLSLKF